MSINHSIVIVDRSLMLLQLIAPLLREVLNTLQVYEFFLAHKLVVDSLTLVAVQVKV
jgi:hypothetical protein